jgi:hypothetical protein
MVTVACTVDMRTISLPNMQLLLQTVKQSHNTPTEAQVGKEL